MGIPKLNRLLRTRCPIGIQQVGLDRFRGCKLAIDASIYIYRYLADEMLLEGMFQMLAILCSYDIVPVLVFDGKAPPQKEDVLEERRRIRARAHERSDDIQRRIDDTDSIEEKKELLDELASAKKAQVKVRRGDVERVKCLARALSVSFLDADGEADVLCAQLVNRQYAFACLSEDMDMFVYGCKRVVRYMSLLNRTVVLYDLAVMLEEMQMTSEELRQMCVLAGTDYNRKGARSMSMDQASELFELYREARDKEAPVLTDFYEWLESGAPAHASVQKISNIYELYSVSYMFDLSQLPFPKGVNSSELRNGPVVVENVARVLQEDGFVFPEVEHGLYGNGIVAA